jgi:hypothetical protein
MALSPFMTRNQLVLAKAQTTAGTDAAPTLSNAVLCEPPTADAAIQTVTTNEMLGGLDTSPALYAGAWRTFNTTIHVKGSGTAGTAPDFDPLLQGCALGLSTFAADVTGTATAGGASTITLAAGASAVNDFYKGLVIELTTGTGSTQAVPRRTILGYNGSTKVATVTPAWGITYADGSTGVTPDATTAYAIRKGTLYQPISTNIPLITIYRYLQNRGAGNASLDKTIDWQGSCTFTVTRGDCTMAFTGQGSMLDDVDISWPGSPTYLNTTAVPLLNGLVAFNNTLAKLNLTLNLNNTIGTEEDPNAANGYSQAYISQRAANGTARMPRLLKSSIDVMTNLRNQTNQVFSAVWGGVAGNRVSMLVPQAVFTGRSATDVNGVVHDSLAYATSGANTGVYLYFW